MLDLANKVLEDYLDYFGLKALVFASKLLKFLFAGLEDFSVVLIVFCKTLKKLLIEFIRVDFSTSEFLKFVLHFLLVFV